ncbi:MAG TPA: ABC transporter ATP-binding protein [Nitrososphaeraceae archaeon]|jgi:multiple sugar transport system ATP-binding protein
MLRLKNLTKKYGNVMALENFSLEIDSGQFMVLLGPSGCGKTTVLRCVSGLTSPTGGEIYIGNELVNDLPPKDRDVAMVFQNYSLYPHMSVYENIAFPLKMRKTERQKVDERVRNIANLLNIETLLNRKPKEISGGQMQRVALGRALVRKPKIFLMDEPLSNLDAKLRTEMRVEIKKLQKKVGITTLYITHDQVEAMSMADSIGIMESGRLHQLGSPNTVYNLPTNQFVASFIGMPPMNFIECKIIRKGSGRYFALDTGDNDDPNQNILLEVPNKLIELLDKSNEDTVILGVRPKDLLLLKSDQAFEGLKLKGQISFIEMLGDESIAELHLGKYLIRTTNLNIAMDDFHVSSEVMLGVNADKIGLYTKTGNRIDF